MNRNCNSLTGALQQLHDSFMNINQIVCHFQLHLSRPPAPCFITVKRYAMYHIDYTDESSKSDRVIWMNV